MIVFSLLLSCLFAGIFLPLQRRTAHALLPSVRPPPDRRTYVSAVIDSLIDGLTPLLQDEDLAVQLMDEHLRNVEQGLALDRKVPSNDIAMALA